MRLCLDVAGSNAPGSSAPDSSRVDSAPILTLRCAVDQVNTKAPFSEGSGFAWHQDASFLKPLARDALDRNGGVNVVVAMDASDAGNGGFEVLGRTHVRGERRKRQGQRTTAARRNPSPRWLSSTSRFGDARACDRGTRCFSTPCSRTGAGGT